MIRIGRVMIMFFAANPDEEREVVIKGLYGNQIWVQYIETGTDEVLDTPLVRFKEMYREFAYTPEHSFIGRNPTPDAEAGDEWLMWEAESGNWYVVEDPTNPNQEKVDETQSPLHSMPEHPTIQ